MSHEDSQHFCEPANSFSLPSPTSGGVLLKWFLVLTKPSGEKTAKLNLERQGYRVYYPCLLNPVLSRGRWVDRTVSLFPRYLFVQLDTASQSLAPVRSTVGVTSIVTFGTRTAIVQDAIIHCLMQRADPASGLHRLARPLFESGVAVKVVAGAFAGLEGIFERELGEDRVVVLFNLLGRVAPVRIPAGFVVPGCAA